MHISVLSLHTSPAAQPGQGDAGGMNVYVDHTVRALAAAGHTVDVFTADPNGIGIGQGGVPDPGQGGMPDPGQGGMPDPGQGGMPDPGQGGMPDADTTLKLGQNLRLHHLHVDADSKDALADKIDDLAGLLAAHPNFVTADLVWAHYWISAEAALQAVDLVAERDTEAHPGSTAQRVRRPKIIASMHTIGAVKNRDSETEDESPRRLQAEERIAAEVDLLVANTPAERRDLIGECGADPASVIVARPGVDHGLFSPGLRDAARAELGIGTDERLILYVGRMQFIKGTDVVVDALACLRENNPALSATTRGILLGAASGWVDPSLSGCRGGRVSGSRDRGLSADDFHTTLSAAIAAEPNVEVRPPVPAAELVTYYRAADVLLVPSRSESFGLVAAEAAASGLPAIASAVGGLPEIVENGHSGLLIADHNPRHWALTLERLLGDEELRDELAGHAAQRSERFDWDTTVATVLDALTAPASVGTGSGSREFGGPRYRSAGVSEFTRSHSGFTEAQRLAGSQGVDASQAVEASAGSPRAHDFALPGLCGGGR